MTKRAAECNANGKAVVLVRWAAAPFLLELFEPALPR